MMNFLTESLKEPIDGDFLITSGREFHKTGPKQLIGIRLSLNEKGGFYTDGENE